MKRTNMYFLLFLSDIHWIQIKNKCGNLGLKSEWKAKNEYSLSLSPKGINDIVKFEIVQVKSPSTYRVEKWARGNSRDFASEVVWSPSESMKSIEVPRSFFCNPPKSHEVSRSLLRSLEVPWSSSKSLEVFEVLKSWSLEVLKSAVSLLFQKFYNR